MAQRSWFDLGDSAMASESPPVLSDSGCDAFIGRQIVECVQRTDRRVVSRRARPADRFVARTLQTVQFYRHALAQLDHRVLPRRGESAIDDRRTAEHLDAAGFVDVAADDQIGLRPVDKTPQSRAADVLRPARQVDHLGTRRGMGENDVMGRLADLSVAVEEKPGQLLFREVVHLLPPRWHGRKAMNADAVQHDAAAVQRNAEFQQPPIDLGRIAVASDGPDIETQRTSCIYQLFSIVRRAKAGDVPPHKDEFSGAVLR